VTFAGGGAGEARHMARQARPLQEFECLGGDGGGDPAGGVRGDGGRSGSGAWRGGWGNTPLNSGRGSFGSGWCFVSSGAGAWRGGMVNR
jgi:hypothetical protein